MEVKTLNLYEGQRVETYREMCMLLDEPEKTGNSKIAQIKKWERYISLDRDKRAFIIREVYDEPLPKVDGRINNGGNNTVYGTLLDNLIITYLSKTKQDTINITFNQFFTDGYKKIQGIQLLTDDYLNIINGGYQNFAERNSMSKGLVMEYMLKLKKVVGKNFETALNRLKRNNLIKWDKKIIVVFTNGKQDIANDELVKKIKEHEKDISEANGWNYFSNLDPKIKTRFRDEVLNALKKDNQKVSKYWIAYQITIIDREDIDRQSKITSKSYYDDKVELTNRYIDTLRECINNIKGKNNNSTHIGKSKNLKYPYRHENHQLALRMLEGMLWTCCKEITEDEATLDWLDDILPEVDEDEDNKYSNNFVDNDPQFLF